MDDEIEVDRPSSELSQQQCGKRRIDLVARVARSWEELKKKMARQ